MAILKDNEYTEFEGRDYINPQVSLDESNAFIDNLRSTQQANTQQIKTDTYNLGTAVPSNLGGLTGGEGYFTARYQTPQTNSLVNDLRATAQASALNQILQNEQEKWKNRYNKARNANAIRNANSSIQNPYGNAEGDDPDKVSTTPKGTAEVSTYGYDGTYTLTDMAGNLHVVDMNTGDEEVLQPGQKSQTRQSVSSSIGGGELRTLPNGNRVWVKPGYGLTKDDNKYYLVNQSTGERTEVGGY